MGLNPMASICATRSLICARHELRGPLGWQVRGMIFLASSIVIGRPVGRSARLRHVQGYTLYSKCVQWCANYCLGVRAATATAGLSSIAYEPRWNPGDSTAARRQRPAVESAIHNLKHRGLDRVRAYGADGFDRVVALSVLAFNLPRLGLLLRRRALSWAQRRRSGA